MKRIILLRHGVTVDNQSAVIQGQTDGQLTELGREQARATGRYLSEQNIGRAVTSDLARARGTLLEVLKFVDCPWTQDPRLREQKLWPVPRPDMRRVRTIRQGQRVRAAHRSAARG